MAVDNQTTEREVTTRFKMPRVRSSTHLEWIRSLPCIVPGCRVWRLTGVHAHHVRIGAGTALKPGDDMTIPACYSHHSQGHDRGWKTFEAKYGLNLEACAAWLAFLSRCEGRLPRDR